MYTSCGCKLCIGNAHSIVSYSTPPLSYSITTATISFFFFFIIGIQYIVSNIAPFRRLLQQAHFFVFTNCCTTVSFEYIKKKIIIICYCLRVPTIIITACSVSASKLFFPSDERIYHNVIYYIIIFAWVTFRVNQFHIIYIIRPSLFVVIAMWCLSYAIA